MRPETPAKRESRGFFEMLLSTQLDQIKTFYKNKKNRYLATLTARAGATCLAWCIFSYSAVHGTIQGARNYLVWQNRVREGTARNN